MTVFRARHAELGAATSRPPLQAWDVAGIAEQYETFIARWRPLLPRVRARRVGGAAAVRARTEIMDTYRRFAVLDPRLPVRLLPHGWPREAALDVFTAVYDGLAAAAERHVRAVVARHADGPASDVGAHTVADIRAGVLEGAGPARVR